MSWNEASAIGSLRTINSGQSTYSSRTLSAYFTENHPATVGSTGQRAFATDTRGTIYFNNMGVAVTAGMAGASPLQ